MSFEGVDTSVLDSILFATVKSIGLFVLLPCIVAYVIAYFFKLSKRAGTFLIGLFGVIGIFAWLMNFDKVSSWLS